MANENVERAGAVTLRGNSMTLVGPELKTGQKAPDFDAVNDSMQPVNLEKTGHTVRIFSVIPSLDTPVCDAQTKRFNEEAAKLEGVDIFTVSMDLPFAQKRWCGAFGIDRVKRSEEHTSELQSHVNLVCRLLLEKKLRSRSGRAPALGPGLPLVVSDPVCDW